MPRRMPSSPLSLTLNFSTTAGSISQVPWKLPEVAHPDKKSKK